MNNAMPLRNGRRRLVKRMMDFNEFVIQNKQRREAFLESGKPNCDINSSSSGNHTQGESLCAVPCRMRLTRDALSFNA